MDNIKRGELYYADLSPIVGSEQGGVRPVLIVQNDIGNKYSPTTIVAAITSQSKNPIPTHVAIPRNKENGLKVDSVIMLEQIRTIDKSRIKDRIGRLRSEEFKLVINAFKTSLSI